MRSLFKKLFTILLIAELVMMNIAPVVRAEEAGADTQTVVNSAPATDTVGGVGASVEVHTGDASNPTPQEPAPQEATSTEQVSSQETPTPTAEVANDQSQKSSDVTATPIPEITVVPTAANNHHSDKDSQNDDRAKLEERRARSRAAADAYLSKEQGDENRTESATSAYVKGVDLTGKVGDSTIQTGDNTISSAIVNTGNNNLAGSASVAGNPESSAGIQVATGGNGSFSDNSGAVVVDNSSSKIQNNNASVNTSLNQSATTGDNNNSKNTGGNSTIKTGDANSSGTVVTAVNTNVDGVMVSEFNIADNQTGDIILDFGAGCITGCGQGPINVTNSGNGILSGNEGSVTEINNNDTFQNNDANVGNELVLKADTGNNTANDNTGGNTDIKTGNANVAANALTFANNNIAGNVAYAVVNIFGDLIGDIILPESAINNCCGTSEAGVKNSGNGSSSDNNAKINSETNTNFDQTNLAEVNNELILDAKTGDNSTSDNTGGNSTITTGNTDVKASVLNVVNNNLVGGNMWLVLINDAGNWVGKLMGAPEGSNMAASQGTEFRVGNDGQIYATNSGNGTGSLNTADVNTVNNKVIDQDNKAVVNNKLDLSANTGNNTENGNTGGDNSIKTGDAKIVANMVNFINNNIAGDGKLIVTVVNVFGKWLGDFVTPGQKKENKVADTASEPVNTVSEAVVNPTPVSENNKGAAFKDDSSSSNNTGYVAGAVAAVQSAIATITQPQSDNGVALRGRGMITKIAGMSTSKEDKLLASNDLFNPVSKEKTIHINLAWLILLIPILAIYFVIRKLVWNRYIKGKMGK